MDPKIWKPEELFFCKCSRWATFIGMNGMLAWNTVFNLLNIFMAEEAYHVNWRWWSSSQTKETSLSMSIKQKRDIRRLVVSWYYTGWLVALTSQATLPCYSKRWQRRLLIHVCIDIWKKYIFQNIQTSALQVFYGQENAFNTYLLDLKDAFSVHWWETLTVNWNCVYTKTPQGTFKE